MSEFLARLFRWLAELLGLREEPEEPRSPASAGLTLEVDDMDLVATVTWPTQRQGGRPLPQSEIANCQLYLAVVDSDEWYVAWGDPVSPDGNPSFEQRQVDIDAGDWFVRAVITDTGGRTSTVTGSITVGGELSAPATAGLSLRTEDPNA